MKIKPEIIKPLRVTAAVIAFSMIAWLLYFANSLLGNPVSYFIVKGKAEKYVAENHADEGYVLESVSYSFKDGTYLAHFSTPGDENSHFSMRYSMGGKMLWNYYTSLITDSGNIRTELNTLYRELVDNALERPDFPYVISDIAYGEIIFEGDGSCDFAIPNSELTPDSTKDIAELGRRAGVLTVYVLDGEAGAECAAEVLLGLKEFMEGVGVPFHAVELCIEAPDGKDYTLPLFLADDITPDGLTERAEESHRRLMEEYARLDAKRR